SVFPNSEILTITNLNDRYMVVSMEQQGALRVRRGQYARLSFDSIREKTFQGIVESIYSQGNDFLARINLENLPYNILPGMTADVAIAIKEHKDVLLVPIAALGDGAVYLREKFK